MNPPTTSQNAEIPSAPVDEQNMHQQMSQEQIRYHLMQKKFEEHQKLMARVEERKQRLEKEAKEANEVKVQEEP
jgi:hypothetical protein